VRATKNFCALLKFSETLAPLLCQRNGLVAGERKRSSSALLIGESSSTRLEQKHYCKPGNRRHNGAFVHTALGRWPLPRPARSRPSSASLSRATCTRGRCRWRCCPPPTGRSLRKLRENVSLLRAIPLFAWTWRTSCCGNGQRSDRSQIREWRAVLPRKKITESNKLGNTHKNSRLTSREKLNASFRNMNVEIRP